LRLFISDASSLLAQRINHLDDAVNPEIPELSLEYGGHRSYWKLETA
jgi:hypothetical protein